MTTTAILDLNESTEAYVRRYEEEYQAHSMLTKTVRYGELNQATKWDFEAHQQLPGSAPVFIQLAGSGLNWEWRIWDLLAAITCLIVGITTLYPLVWAIQNTRYDSMQPQSLNELAKSQYPWRGLEPLPT